MIYLIVLIVVLVVILGLNAKKESKVEPVKEEPQSPPVNEPLKRKPVVTVTVQHDDPQEPKVKRLRYFCIKDKGYHVSVWAKDAGMQDLDYIEFPIAGISHRENIGNYLGEHLGTLEEEPDNPYDANAIKILAGDGHHLGYVPRDYIFDVRKFITLPCKCYIYIGENDGVYFSDCYINQK